MEKASVCYRKCSGHALQTKIDESMEAFEMDTKEYGNMVKHIWILEDERVSAKKECERMENWRAKKEGSPGRNTKGFGKSLRWEVHGQGRVMEHRQEENVGRQRSLVQGRRRLALGIPSDAQRKFSPQLVAGGRWKVKKRKEKESECKSERERWGKEAKEEESKSGKGEVEGGRGSVEIGGKRTVSESCVQQSFRGLLSRF